jgi:hypothetical protein
MDNEMKTMIRKIGEDTAGIREELAAVNEEKRELRKRRKMAGGGGRWMKRMNMIEEKMKQRE